jgi:HK97 gp10 family phage protein
MAQSRIEGFRECREALQELSTTVQRNVGRRALQVPAGIIRDAVEARAPVSPRGSNQTPGSLKASIKVGKENSKRTEAKLHVIAEDVAAVPLEFGLTSRDYPAQPFFRPAVDSVEGQALQGFANALRPEVTSAVAKAAKRAQKAK